MKKSKMIEALLAIPGDPEVKIYDHRKSMNQDDGDAPTQALYDFDIDVLNDTLSQEEVAEIKEVHGFTPNPIIALFFNNEDFDDEGKESSGNDLDIQSDIIKIISDCGGNNGFVYKPDLMAKIFKYFNNEDSDQDSKDLREEN